MTDLEYEQIGLIVLKKWFKDKLRIDISDADIQAQYSLALKMLINDAKALDNIPKGVVQVAENSISMTYKGETEAWKITGAIYALLPTPKNIYAW